MGKHLRVDRWFDVTSTGSLRRKRISAAKEAQFPKELRIIYQKEGLPSLTRKLRESGASLSEAWEKIKQMFND